MRTSLFNILIACALAVVLAGCGDVPIFDELATNRLTVVIKGTFESNNPRAWSTGFVADDSVDDVTFALSQPTEFMLDIAEMRLRGDGSADKFAFYRKTYSIPLSDAEPFFNGVGITYKNDDPYSNYRYTTLLMYIRKMIFNNALDYIYYYPAYQFYEYPETIFSEDDTLGFDFNQLQYNTFWDSLRVEAEDTNRVFPIEIPIYGDLVFDNNEPETVLEIRLVVKNFIKGYEYDYMDDDGYRHALQFWGLSDWLRDAKRDEGVIGGNVLAVARTYVPGKTATVKGTATANRYVIALTEDDLTSYTLLDANKTRPNYSNDTTPGADLPPSPHLVDPTSVDSVLDYLLMYEKYKVDYNSFITNYVNTSIFANVWDALEANVSAFRIPPIATLSTGSYRLENLPVGKTYYIYRSNTDAANAALPNAYTKIGSVSISSDAAGLEFTVNE